MNLKSEKDILREMERLVRQAVDDITKEVLDLFKRQYVRRYVYDSHGANKKYHAGSRKPTYQFEKAWEWTELRKQVNILATEMWFNWETLNYNESTFLHGSKYSSPNDVRENLMDILNKKGYSSSLWLSVSRDVPYWDKFIEDMFARRQLEKIVEKHFVAKGFSKA